MSPNVPTLNGLRKSFFPVIYRVTPTVKEMNINEILEVLADDPVAEEDIKSWVKKSENELIFFNKDDKLLKFLIRKVK